MGFTINRGAFGIFGAIAVGALIVVGVLVAIFFLAAAKLAHDDVMEELEDDTDLTG